MVVIIKNSADDVDEEQRQALAGPYVRLLDNLRLAMDELGRKE
jgi:hypothetical protein